MTTFLRAFANKTGVWGEKAGLFGLYQLGLLFLFVCDHGHGSVMLLGHLMDLVGSGLGSFVALGQEALRVLGEALSSLISVGQEVLSAWWKVVAIIVVLASTVVYLVTHVNVHTLHTQVGYYVLDCYNQERRAVFITRRHCREFYARPDLKSQDLGDYVQAFCDLRAEIAGRPYRMNVYQLIEFLNIATWDERGAGVNG